MAKPPPGFKPRQMNGMASLLAQSRELPSLQQPDKEAAEMVKHMASLRQTLFENRLRIRRARAAVQQFTEMVNKNIPESELRTDVITMLNYIDKMLTEEHKRDQTDAGG